MRDIIGITYHAGFARAWYKDGSRLIISIADAEILEKLI